jgi:sialic acid synthase SpsE
MKDILLQIDKYNKYNTSGTEIIYYNCTSEYPTKSENVHLNRHKSKFMEGFSDHSSGVFAMVLASIIGVKYIEKHFSIDADAKPWNVSTTQMRWYNRMMEMVNEFFVDKGMSEEEIKNYEFYKKEFKDLSFLI